MQVLLHQQDFKQNKVLGHTVSAITGGLQYKDIEFETYQ
jgi:hypothetical protein